MASACCSPPDSAALLRFSNGPSSGKASTTRFLSHGPFRFENDPTARFSSTVSDGKIRRPSGTSEIPCSTRRGADNAASDVPA